MEILALYGNLTSTCLILGGLFFYVLLVISLHFLVTRFHYIGNKTPEVAYLLVKLGWNSQQVMPIRNHSVLEPSMGLYSTVI